MKNIFSVHDHDSQSDLSHVSQDSLKFVFSTTYYFFGNLWWKRALTRKFHHNINFLIVYKGFPKFDDGRSPQNF